MDFTSIVLVQIAIFSCLATLLPTSRSNSSLKISAIIVLTILSMSWYYLPGLTAKVGLGLWVALILIPMSMIQRLESLVNSSQYLVASKLAKRVRWIVPTDGMWHYHHLLTGIHLAQAGELDNADAIFDRYQPNTTLSSQSSQRSQSSVVAKNQSLAIGLTGKSKLGADRHQLSAIGRSATALLYRSTDRWQEYLDWVQLRLTPEQLQLDRGTILVYYLRAFAETGDLRRCIAEVDRLDRSGQVNNQQLNFLKMYVLAYCGRVEAVIQSCQNLLAMYPAEVRQFWIATAELASSHATKLKTIRPEPINSQAIRQELLELQQMSGDSCIQQDIAWRLTKPLPTLAKLSPLDWETVDRLEASVSQDAHYIRPIPTNAPTPVTNWLIAINILVFCAELFLQSRSQNPDFSFTPVGGLTAPLVLAGEWWRILTANFLHFNALHLGMNMLGLLYLGKFVEYRLGSVRYFVAYLLAGLGSMAVITYVDTHWVVRSQTTVGASGAIMGMLGAMGAIHLSGWRQGKTAAAGRQFQAVLFSVGFQLVFDITNGHTSIVGHFSGLAIGFVVGLILLRFGVRESD
jgi:rhomboid protease GluP